MAQTNGGAANGLSLVALAFFVLGPLLAMLGVVTPFTGFKLFGLGGLLGLVTLLLSIRTARSSGVASAGRGLAIGGGILLVAIVGGMPGCGVPRINDITTDVVDPPRFVKAPSLPENEGRDMSYPGKSFADQQQTGYPDLAPLALPQDPATVFTAVEAAAKDMGTWEITRVDAEARELEGYDTSRLFRFVDDFIIQVRPGENGGSAVHMRSKSRVGKSDMGANSARIEAFFAKVKAR